MFSSCVHRYPFTFLSTPERILKTPLVLSYLILRRQSWVSSISCTAKQKLFGLIRFIISTKIEKFCADLCPQGSRFFFHKSQKNRSCVCWCLQEIRSSLSCLVWTPSISLKVVALPGRSDASNDSKLISRKILIRLLHAPFIDFIIDCHVLPFKHYDLNSYPFRSYSY